MACAGGGGRGGEGGIVPNSFHDVSPKTHLQKREGESDPPPHPRHKAILLALNIYWCCWGCVCAMQKAVCLRRDRQSCRNNDQPLLLLYLQGWRLCYPHIDIDSERNYLWEVLASLVCFLLDYKTFICQPLTTVSQTLQLSVACCHQKQQHIILGAIKSPGLKTVTLGSESGWMQRYWGGGAHESVSPLEKQHRGGVRCAPHLREALWGPWGDPGSAPRRRGWGCPGRGGGAEPRSSAQTRAVFRGERGHPARDTLPPHMCLKPKPAERRAASLPSVTSALRLRVLMSINV